MVIQETEEELKIIKRMISFVDDNGIKCVSIETSNSYENVELVLYNHLEKEEIMKEPIKPREPLSRHIKDGTMG